MGLYDAQKADLRAHMIAQRRALVPAVRQQEQAEWERLFQDLFKPTAETLCIGGYMADDGELGIGPVLSSLRIAGHRLALPSVVAGGQLIFRHWTQPEAVQKGRFGIIEATGPDCVPDLVLMPLVACSPSGDRLGRGGGYYDRWLEGAGSTSYRLGVAFSFQCVDTVPHEHHDQKLNAILTAGGLVCCQPAASWSKWRDRDFWRL